MKPIQQIGAILEATVIIADWFEKVSCSEGQGAQMYHRHLGQQGWNSISGVPEAMTCALFSASR
jgi:hypothetical protein